MLTNTAQLEHRIVVMSALLVTGVLVELAMPTLQVMHTQLVLTQKEKEGHPTSTVTTVRKGIIAPQQVQLHRCLVHLEHMVLKWVLPVKAKSQVISMSDSVYHVRRDITVQIKAIITTQRIRQTLECQIVLSMLTKIMRITKIITTQMFILVGNF